MKILVVQAVLLGIAVAVGRWWLYPLLWVAPYLTVWRVINRLRAIGEHGGMDASTDRRATTHTVRQSWWSRCVLAPYMIGWHLPHHVDAGVSMRHLPQYHRASATRATSRRASSTRAIGRCGGRYAREPPLRAVRVRKLNAVERWFQNSRGLIIVVLAIATGALLLAIEPGDGFPTGSGGSSGGGSATATTTVPTPASSTTTTLARPVLQEGSTGADVTVLQQRLAALGYDVGAPDGNFGAGTKQAVIDFQTAKQISPADGVVNAATWAALLATQ